MVCISPLTSLMMDQRAKFTPRGLTTEFVGEAQSDQATVRKVLRGETQLVLITPESIIGNALYRNMLLSTTYKEKLVALVVDEAHCVKTWGDQFRKTFSMIGDLRSIVPTGVNMMALTATATTETFHVVSKRLAMTNPTLVALPPDRGNFVYRVHPKASLIELCDSLCKEFTVKRTDYPKTVIFVRQYRDCSDLYLMLQHKLGSAFTEPPGYPNVSQFRMVEMYSRVLTNEKKEQVLSSFTASASKLRIVIATSAFGLGVDIPDIRRVMHWGLPTNFEEYVQETGRAGRDGCDAEAILYEGKGGRHAIKKMKENSTVCRRRFLFEDFLKFYEKDIRVCGCKCCDICARSCTCSLCQQ